MKEGDEILQTHCLNCNAVAQGDYCYDCGQRLRDNSDRSLSQLAGEFLGNIFFLDNRFFLSMWYLLRYPGRMTAEFLEGKRKKFISPVTLFLFFNLIYFFASPLTDFSIAFKDQVFHQPYSGEWTLDWARLKLQNLGLDETAYSSIFQNTSDTISKSVMIINIPVLAIFVFLMAFKKRRFYYDSLIYSFHFFALFLASWIMITPAMTVASILAGSNSPIASEIAYQLFAFGIPTIYAILSMKKFLNIKWYWAIPTGLFVMLGWLMSNLLYRLIIFILTMLAT
ncbi:MAG: DUF3667 domain-containing protein [Saprospiraceae bacterium]